jgi:hypothetical protein
MSYASIPSTSSLDFYAFLPAYSSVFPSDHLASLFTELSVAIFATGKVLGLVDIGRR